MADGDGQSFAAAEALHDDGFGAQRGLGKATGLGKLRLELGRGRSVSFFAAATGAAFELPGALRNADVARGSIGFYDSYDGAQRGTSACSVVGLDYRAGTSLRFSPRPAVRGRAAAHGQAQRDRLFSKA